MLGLVMNVQYALADYGIETNSLPIETVYGSTTTIKTTTGEHYWCDGSNLVERCVNYNPCDGFY